MVTWKVSGFRFDLVEMGVNASGDHANDVRKSKPLQGGSQRGPLCDFEPARANLHRQLVDVTMSVASVFIVKYCGL